MLTMFWYFILAHLWQCRRIWVKRTLRSDVIFLVFIYWVLQAEKKEILFNQQIWQNHNSHFLRSTSCQAAAMIKSLLVSKHKQADLKLQPNTSLDHILKKFVSSLDLNTKIAKISVFCFGFWTMKAPSKTSFLKKKQTNMEITEKNF